MYFSLVFGYVLEMLNTVNTVTVSHYQTRNLAIASRLCGNDKTE